MSLDRTASRLSRRIRTPLALVAASALFPYIAQARGHPSVFSDSKSAGKAPAPAVVSPGAVPGQQGTSTSGSNSLRDLALNLNDMVCTNGGYGRKSDYFKTATEAPAMFRWGGKNYLVTLDVIPVRMPNISADEQGDYAAIRTSDRNLTGNLIGLGTKARDKPDPTVAAEKDAIAYLDMVDENGQWVFIKAPTKKVKPTKFTVPDPKKPGKTKTIEITLNVDEGVRAFTTAADLYLLDVWGPLGTTPGQLDYMTAAVPEPGSIGVVRSKERDRFGLRQYDPRYENISYHAGANITGLERSVEDRFNDAFDRHTRLPVPIPTPPSP